jgi:hypothetical protein
MSKSQAMSGAGEVVSFDDRRSTIDDCAVDRPSSIVHRQKGNGFAIACA